MDRSRETDLLRDALRAVAAGAGVCVCTAAAFTAAMHYDMQDSRMPLDRPSARPYWEAREPTREYLERQRRRLTGQRRELEADTQDAQNDVGDAGAF